MTVKGLARQAIKAWLATVMPRRRYVVSGPRASQAVCLTFDDGPHPEHTPRLLDELGNQSIKATFFVIGEQAARHPDLIRRTAAEGHSIGTHTYYHRDPKETSAAQLRSETERSCSVISEILGTPPPTLFRPPYGKLTPSKLFTLWQMAQTVVLWNVDPKDFERAHTADVRTFFADWVPQSGDVVLMHDNLPHAAEVLPNLAISARDHSLSFWTVDAWI